jgi:hypothetical protein
MKHNCPLKNPHPDLSGGGFYISTFDEAEINNETFADEGSQRRKCTCIQLPVGLHNKKDVLWSDTLFYTIRCALNAFPHGIFGGYHLHGPVRG